MPSTRGHIIVRDVVSPAGCERVRSENGFHMDPSWYGGPVHLSNRHRECVRQTAFSGALEQRRRPESFRRRMSLLCLFDSTYWGSIRDLLGIYWGSQWGSYWGSTPAERFPTFHIFSN